MRSSKPGIKPSPRKRGAWAWGRNNIWPTVENIPKLNILRHGSRNPTKPRGEIKRNTWVDTS